jgi:hypothetical protein
LLRLSGKLANNTLAQPLKRPLAIWVMSEAAYFTPADRVAAYFWFGFLAVRCNLPTFTCDIFVLFVGSPGAVVLWRERLQL